MLDIAGSTDLVSQLSVALDTRRVLTSARETERYRKGFRSGEGDAAAVCFPKTLVELWNVLQICVDTNAIIIMQAANTGLTEGSTPNGTYDRPVVIISTLGMDTIHPILGGEQVVALPGATLYTLEKLLKPLGRAPHSEIGSACIGASVIGGICNNSGGALVKRGPAYTELSVFAQRGEDGVLRLVNNLGIDLGRTPEEILTRLETGDFDPKDIERPQKQASDREYAERVRDVDANTPARYNADPRRLHEASGCAGKVAVFAVRLDTFPEEEETAVFYIGTNSTGTLADLRRSLLSELSELPVLAEDMHRDIFDVAETYGKDTFLMINWLGTDRLPLFFTLKGRADAIFKRLSIIPDRFTDLFMQGLSRLFLAHLPKRLTAFRDQFEHHLILKVAGPAIAETEALLDKTLGSEGYFRCSDAEGRKALLHRFAAAGAAVRYAAVHQRDVEDILALDIALRRNDRDWMEELPPEITDHLISKLYYGHFLCHVFHQDYIVRKGSDPKALKAAMLALLDKRGAEYPAEHIVGHLYTAKSSLKAHYEALDPTNSFNPGLGKTSKDARGAACGCGGH
jgi:D-lactate dehydrogenase